MSTNNDHGKAVLSQLQDAFEHAGGWLAVCGHRIDDETVKRRFDHAEGRLQTSESSKPCRFILQSDHTKSTILPLPEPVVAAYLNTGSRPITGLVIRVKVAFPDNTAGSPWNDWTLADAEWLLIYSFKEPLPRGTSSASIKLGDDLSLPLYSSKDIKDHPVPISGAALIEVRGLPPEFGEDWPHVVYKWVASGEPGACF